MGSECAVIDISPVIAAESSAVSATTPSDNRRGRPLACG